MSQHGYSPPSKMDSHRPPSQEGSIDILIETLTGNTFEITISSSDTISALKSKIQRVEGIPVSAQHLLFHLSELEDDSKISDHSISNGSTLRLVTSMRGGPISTRRVSPIPEERAWMDLVDSNRCDDILQHIPSGQLTVLVFCEGEQLNLFRVVENVDGTYSPVTDPVKTSSIRNALTSEEPDAAAQRLRENTVTMGKMKELQRKLCTGMQRRKMKIGGSQETSSTDTIPESYVSTNTEGSGRTGGWKFQPTLQLASKPDTLCARTVPEQAHSLRLSSLSKKSLPCPHRKLTLPRLEPPHMSQVNNLHLSQLPASRPFLPVLPVPSRAQQELSRQPSTSSAQGQSLRIPAPPRLIAPPLHVPPLLQRPPALRPVWDQRQGPVPVVIPEMNSRPAPLPKIRTLIKDDNTLQYVSPQPSVPRVQAMCQSRRRLDPLMPQRELLTNVHTGIQQPQLHLHSSNQSDPQNGAMLHPGVASGLPKRNTLINVSNCTFVPNVVIPQPAPQLPGACHFVLLRGPNTSPKERFSEYLTAYLTQSFSSRFSGMIPENLPMRLSHQLTKRLSHHFVGGLSDVAVNRLSFQLSNRISQFLEECLTSRCPKDVLGQALRTILEERTTQGYPLVGGCNRNADVWDPHMRVAVRGLPSFNADVGTNYIHAPEPIRDNGRGTRELFAPRFHSAPTPLPSQGPTVRHSVFTGLQREPLFVRLNDSAVYQRGMVPVLVRPATSPSFPPPIFCNTIQTGPPSTELLRRVIESSVPQLRQPPLQTEIQRDQSQVQVMNGVGRMMVPFRSPPPFADPSQQPVFGFQPQGIRLRTVRYSVHPNLQPRLTTETPQTELQTANETDQDGSENNSANTEPKLPKKSSPRCCQCRKKLTISNNYLCRCQKHFCSTHRYSEAHNCSHDYKEEGRRLLQQENPQVMAEKIVKM